MTKKPNLFAAATGAEAAALSGGVPPRSESAEERVTSTIRINRGTLTEIKVRAAHEGIRPNTLIERAILQYLSRG